MFSNKSAFPYLTASLSWVHLVHYFTVWRRQSQELDLAYGSHQTPANCAAAFSHLVTAQHKVLHRWEWLTPAGYICCNCCGGGSFQLTVTTQAAPRILEPIPFIKLGIYNDKIQVTSETGVRNPHKCSRDQFSLFCEPSPGALRNTLSAVSL